MNETSVADLRSSFVDEMGVILAETGGSVLHGRVLALLLVCDPPHRSLTEMAADLRGSKGALSVVARQLEAANVLEKVPVPGRRGTFYRIRDGAWEIALTSRVQATRRMREHAAQGLHVATSDSARRRLRSMMDFYAFVEVRLMDLIHEWRQAQER